MTTTTKTTTTSAPLLSTASFYSTELEAALKEQSFGIRAYCLLPSASPLDHDAGETGASARAQVSLFEGDEVEVEVSAAGWKAVGAGRSAQRETLDDLLLALSPEYERRRLHTLMARLERLAERRDASE